MFAHNDWLELLSNFGLFGVIVYIMLFFAAYKLIRNPNWGDTDKRLFMLTVIIMWFLITLFSMGYTSSDGYLKAMLLAYLIGNRNKALFFKKII